MVEKRLTGDERRDYILERLKNSGEPLTGQILSEETNVSRQIIVQDISILKAKNMPILATSQGYIYVHKNDSTYPFKRIIACKHFPEQTRDELFLLVDHGIFVRNVIVEHPIYGELTASLMLKSRVDVYEFLDKMEKAGASYLSDLTEGVHLHTLEAATEKQLSEAIKALESAGLLLSKE